MASPNVNLVKYLAFCVSLQWFLVKKLKKNGQKMLKNYLNLAIFLRFFNFFQKIPVLSSPKLLCSYLPFLPTYSQGNGHLDTKLVVQFFFFFFPLFFKRPYRRILGTLGKPIQIILLQHQLWPPQMLT